MTDPQPAEAISTVDPNAIRAELEATRSRYHELLDSLSEEDWNKKSGNPAWNVRQLMWHMAWSYGYVGQGVESCRKGKGLNPPTWIADPLNSLISRLGSRGATRESVGKKYDEGHQKTLPALDGVQEDEWQKAARVFNRDMTIEKTFRDVTEHFKEHEADIKKGLGRIVSG